MDILIDRIKKHEGYRNYIYVDSKGNLTTGWGHHLYNGSFVSKEINELFFKQDIANAVSDFYRLAKTFNVSLYRILNKPRQRVIVEMLFNMNAQKVLQFKKMWSAILKQDWPEASREMLSSRWHQQVGSRARVLAKIMEDGVDP